MWFSPFLSLLSVRLAVAEWKRSPAGEQSLDARSLLAGRDSWDDQTCAERWGAGFIICNLNNCFNPAEEQCCAGTYTCAGSDISCCDIVGGPGITGTDGVPTTFTLATPVTPPASTATSSTCSLDVSGDECCQRLSSSLHWCSGSYPSYNCYIPSSQSCCSDGSICLADGCCNFVGATAITPNATQATALPSVGSSTTSGPGSVNVAATTTQAGAAQSTSLAASATGPSVGEGGTATRNTIGGMAVVALGMLSMALL